MAWRGGALVIASAAVSASTALAVNAAVHPGPPAQPIGAPTTTAPSGPPVTATLSSDRPGARPVTLTVSFRATLLCGRLRGTTAITLPSAAHVPDTVPAAAVTVNGTPAGRVAVTGSTLTVTPAAP